MQRRKKNQVNGSRSRQRKELQKIEDQNHRKLKEKEEKYKKALLNAKEESKEIKTKKLYSGVKYEPIMAEVIEDIMTGNLKRLPGNKDDNEMARMVSEFANTASKNVIDMTEIAETIWTGKEDDAAYRLYDDFKNLILPYKECIMAYHSADNNNIKVAVCLSDDANNHSKEVVHHTAKTVHPSDPEVDPEEIKWINHFYLFGGGYSGSKKVKPFGPILKLIWALDKNGSPLNFIYNAMGEIDMTDDELQDSFSYWILTLCRSLDLMNCQNIYIDNPPRRKTERKRIEQHLGPEAVINTLYIKLPKQQNTVPLGEHLTNLGGNKKAGVVRAHFAHYGPEYGTGKLFGKYSGRFFIPQHTRGNKEVGEVKGHKIKLRKAS